MGGKCSSSGAPVQLEQEAGNRNLGNSPGKVTETWLSTVIPVISPRALEDWLPKSRPVRSWGKEERCAASSHCSPLGSAGL